MKTSLLLTKGLLYLILNGGFINCDEWKNSPPGPPRDPIVGNLFQLSPQQHETYSKWADQYGPIARVDLAATKTVLISNHKLVNEIFEDPKFQGRLDFSLFDLSNDGHNYGVLNTEGKDWEQMRHFAIKHLHEAGRSYGQSKSEDVITEGVLEFIESIKSLEGVPISDLKYHFWSSIGSSLLRILTGKRYTYNDPETLKFTNASMGFKSALEKGGALLVAPVLAKLLPDHSGYSTVRKVVDNFGNTFIPSIEESRKSFDGKSDKESSFTDMFLKQSKTAPVGSPFHGKTGIKHLHGLLGDLYFAGSDTISSTLSFMMLYLSKSPDELQKLKREISSVTNQNARPCNLSDRENMPYTQAVIAETLRLSSIVPQGVQHKATSDGQFHGYSIPNNTIIVPNLYHIHQDPSIWTEPNIFKPERFLSRPFKGFKEHEALLPFSTGYRKCLGEVIARNAIFLYLTGIVQNFHIQFEQLEGHVDNGFEPQYSFISYPKPFSVRFYKIE